MKTTQIEWYTGKPPEDGTYLITIEDWLGDIIVRIASWQNHKWYSLDDLLPYSDRITVVAWALPIEPFKKDKPRTAFEPKEMGECEMCRHARLEEHLRSYCWLKNYRHGKDELPESFICDEPLEY